MNFYWICILYHWDCGNFDLLLDALKLNLLDTSPRVCKPTPAWHVYLLREEYTSSCERKVVLGALSCCI